MFEKASIYWFISTVVEKKKESCICIKVHASLALRWCDDILYLLSGGCYWFRRTSICMPIYYMVFLVILEATDFNARCFGFPQNFSFRYKWRILILLLSYSHSVRLPEWLYSFQLWIYTFVEITITSLQKKAQLKVYLPLHVCIK